MSDSNLILIYVRIFLISFRDWNGLQQTLHEMIDAIVEELLQPNENNLIPQSDK